MRLTLNAGFSEKDWIELNDTDEEQEISSEADRFALEMLCMVPLLNEAETDYVVQNKMNPADVR
jgi:hypothetical protein